MAGLNLEGRIGATSDEASAEVVRKLEAGEPTGLGVVDLVAAIARAALGGEGSDGPGLVQGSPGHPRLERVLSEESLAGLLPGSARSARLALMAGLFQVLDLWDASHAAAQSADDLGERSTAAYWHMVAHRRVPDAGNALYWARRVGRHPIHEPLARAARALLRAQAEPAQAERLAPGGTWDASALIDLATRARPGTPSETLARRLQRLEMIHLLEASLAPLLT
jgi:hypothetical protein